MIASLLRAIAFDCLACVRQEAFFTLSIKERQVKIKKVLTLYPESLSTYLTHCSQQAFVCDFTTLIQSQFTSFTPNSSTLTHAPVDKSLLESFTIGTDTIQLSEAFVSDVYAFLAEQHSLQEKTRSSPQPNLWREAVISFFAHELPLFLDQVEGHALAMDNTALGRSLQHIQQLQEISLLETSIATFLKEEAGFQLATVLSPLPLSFSQRQQIRQDLAKRSSSLVTLFRIDPSLAGGITLFINGTLFDQSWLARIRTLQTVR